MWNDPIWIRWQIEHRIIGDPSAFSIWAMNKMTLTMRETIIPVIRSLNKATISATFSVKRFYEIWQKLEIEVS